jgi:purine-binding chemotaxis protein CheW
MQLCTFFVGGHRFGVEASHVREIVRVGAITPVPFAPPVVLGVTAVRGEVLAVVDVGALLGLPAAAEPQRMLGVVATLPRGTLCLLVPRAGDVAEVSPSQALPPAPLGAEFSRGRYRLDSGQVQHLDLGDLAIALSVALSVRRK